jgi:hypothetical protein
LEVHASTAIRSVALLNTVPHALAPATEVRPAGQASQAVATFAALVNVSTAQFWHWAVPASLKVPAGQKGSHDKDAEGEKVTPRVHSRHAVPFISKPAGQEGQQRAAPPPEKVPALQLGHELDPVMDA